MDRDTARAYLTTPHGRTPTEIGEAVDVLRADYPSYREMARDFSDVSERFLSIRHRIFQLPTGIRWKVDEGKIALRKGVEIARLNNEDDQWVLAFAIVEEELEHEVCNNVVHRVLECNDSIREALSASAGVRCDRVIPFILPLGFDIRLAIAQKAWNRNQELQDYCYDQICQDPDAATRELVRRCRTLLSQFDEAMSELLESHRS